MRFFVLCLATLSLVSAAVAQDPGATSRVRELRLLGHLSEARQLAEEELGNANDPRLEIALRLELARILDRVGLHQNTRPVAAALEEIDAAAAVSASADSVDWAEIELARAEYSYRAEMPDREFPTATAHAHQAAALFRSSGDGHGEAEAVHRLGLIHMQRRELDQARELFDRSLELDRVAGERTFFLGEYERHVGFVYVLNDDVESSIPYFERSLEYRREAHAIDASLFAARTLAWALVTVGRLDEANQPLYYAMAIAQGGGSPVGMMRCTLVLAQVYEAAGDTSAARVAYEVTWRIAESVESESIASRARSAIEGFETSSDGTDSSREAAERDVREAVSAFGRAFVAADVSALRTILSDDYIHVNGRSGNVLHRDRWLAWMTSRRAELDRGEVVIETYDVSDVEVSVIGDVALATGSVISDGHRKGTAFNVRVRFTNVWARQGDAWRRAAFYDTPLPEDS